MAFIHEECDEEFEDESIGERLVGLSEAIPEPIIRVVSNIFDFCLWGGTNIFKASRSLLWIVSTSAVILVLPIAFENERIQAEESTLQQQRQMLLGPNVAVAGQQGGMPPLTATPPS